MHLLIAGVSILAHDTFMVRWDSENWHLNLSLSAVCDCRFPDHTLLLFYVSDVGSVKENLSGKECDKALWTLS